MGAIKTAREEAMEDVVLAQSNRKPLSRDRKDWPPTIKELVTKIAAVLDEAGVPSILFGELALSLFGADTLSSRKVEFVIEDSLMQAAAEALSKAGYAQCTDDNCRVINIHPKEESIKEPCHAHHYVPAVHFHLVRGRLTLSYQPPSSDTEPEMSYDATTSGLTEDWSHVYQPQFVVLDTLLSLQKKSEHLWWIPGPSLSPPGPDEHLQRSDEAARLASCEHLKHDPPRTKWDCIFTYCQDHANADSWETSHPVRLLNPNSFTEAVILIGCRRWAHIDRLDEPWWDLLICLIDADPGTLKKQLSPKFQYAWDCYNRRIKRDHFWDGFRELRRMMKDSKDWRPQ
ncbi:uncharacterized protein BDV14DRAFT_198970 [Aspergillus stella-maris]|uniref:uncharacterized protein n=1 Tax=Aspergillus stella-maris TaxID=1810926 RepID=UPI003CCD55A5